MIAKVTKGSSFGGLTGYLYGPGRHEEHADAHMVGGNLAVEDAPRPIAEELRDVSEENPRVSRPVFHASLSLPEGERLSDEQWREAGETFMDRMGFRDGDREAPWAMVRHDGDEGRHAHIVASRVRFDGSTVSDSFDFKRSHEACRAVEAEHRLSSPQVSSERLATVSRSEREAAKRRDVQPERGELRHALEEARDSGDGTRADFERRARERGVLLRANESPTTGRMNGYSASLEGWKDAKGDQVWMPASKVHKSLRWKQLDVDLADRRQQQAVEQARQPQLSQAAAAMQRQKDTERESDLPATRASRDGPPWQTKQNAAMSKDRETEAQPPESEVEKDDRREVQRESRAAQVLREARERDLEQER